MAYLILPKDEALARNNQEAIKRGCQAPTIYWWSWGYINSDTIWLSVEDGDGLTPDELNSLVDELPSTEIDT